MITFLVLLLDFTAILALVFIFYEIKDIATILTLWPIIVLCMQTSLGFVNFACWLERLSNVFAKNEYVPTFKPNNQQQKQQ